MKKSTRRIKRSDGQEFKDLPRAGLIVSSDGECRINLCMYRNHFCIIYPKEQMEGMSIAAKKRILEQKAKEIHKNLTTFSLVTK